MKMRPSFCLLLLPFLLFLCSCQNNAPSDALDTTSTELSEEVAVEKDALESAADSSANDSIAYVYQDGAIVVDWDLLANVEFEEKFNEEVQALIPYPDFAPIVEGLEGKEIIIQGYIIPTDETGQSDILVLSGAPFSSCFFCGGAGPESVMDIKLVKKMKQIKTDQVATFRGRLKLNATDLYYLNYILEEAEWLE